MACCVIAAYVSGLLLRPIRRMLGRDGGDQRPRPRVAGPFPTDVSD
jgi:hypothetical protein